MLIIFLNKDYPKGLLYDSALAMIDAVRKVLNM